MHYGSAEIAEWLKSISGKIPDGGRRPNWRLDILAFY